MMVNNILNGATNTKATENFTMEEMKTAIKKLKKNKSTGPDRIPAEMLKESPEAILPLLLKITNKIKVTCYYPEEWAKGITSLILKEGSDEDPNNYRAITVANAMSKVLAIMINERLISKIEKEKLIGPQQIGFKKKARTADHLFVLKNCIDNYLSRGKKLYTCFVDFQKAYDNVWRTGMYYKLIKQGIEVNTVKLIKSMYDKTNQVLKINNQITDPFKTYKGVRQGCVISTCLFNLFINDLPDIFDNECKPIKLGNSNLSCLMYADDIVIMSESKDGLQKCLKKLENYIEMWDMSLNQQKTKILTFQRRGKMPQLNLRFKGKDLEQVKQYKYLGTVINRTGNFNLNNQYLKGKGLRARYLITKNIGISCKPSTAIRIFERMVEPIILYNCEVTQAFIPETWSYEKFINQMWDRNIEIDKVVYGFLRQILGINKKTTNIGILSETGKYPINITIYTQMIKYWVRLFTIENKLVQEAHLDSIKRVKERKTSWLRTIIYLLNATNLSNEIDMKELTENNTNLKKSFRNRIIKQYENYWKDCTTRNNEGKLKFYFEHKKIFCFEKYLDNVPRENRIAITKFRLSSHRLPIEKMRYHQVKREERKCSICKRNEVGDEWHYLLKCDNKEIKDVRCLFINKIKNIQIQCHRFQDTNIMRYCMNMGDVEVQLPTALFIKDLMDRYETEEDKRKETSKPCSIM